MNVIVTLPSATDVAREAAIERARCRVVAATRIEDTRAHFREMLRLIGQRSPAQVRRMERARGLT